MRIAIFLFVVFVSTPAISQYLDNTPPYGMLRPPGLVHILDIEISEGRAYSAGSGGLWIIDVADKANPVLLGTHRPARQQGGQSRGGAQIYGMAVRENYLYCCERTNGLEVMDVSNPRSPRSVGQRYLRDSSYSYEQALIVNDYLFLAAHENGVEVLDITNPQQLNHINEIKTFNAFALAHSEDHLFVADGVGGLTVLDISDPTNLQLINTTGTSGLAIDVVISGQYAFVAVGSNGMDVFDITNPAAPMLIKNHHVDGFTNHINISNSRAYLANWEMVEIVDVSDPTQPILVATQHSFERAMSIAVDNNTFYVGDWSALRIYDFENISVPGVNADPLQISFGTVPVGSEQEVALRIENLGQNPLAITDISAIGFGFTVESAAFTLEPSEFREVRVIYQPGDTRRTTGFISIRSNDPDESEKIVPLVGGERTIGIGDVPPDFTLQDVQGQSYHLQDFIDEGKIIIIALFASW